MSSPKPMEWTPERVKRFWDHESKNPDHYFTYTRSTPLVNRTWKHLKTSERILDFGCGRGYLTAELLSRKANVGSADFSPESVEHIRQTYGSSPNLVGAWEVEELERSGERFDGIYLVEVVEHLTDPELEATFDRLRKLTAPGGKVVITTPNKEKLEKKTLYCPCCDHTFHRWGHVRSWTAGSLSDYARQRGWEVLETMETTLPKTIRDRPWKSLWNRITSRAATKKKNLIMVMRAPASQGAASRSAV